MSYGDWACSWPMPTRRICWECSRILLPLFGGILTLRRYLQLRDRRQARVQETLLPEVARLTVPVRRLTAALMLTRIASKQQSSLAQTAPSCRSVAVPGGHCSLLCRPRLNGASSLRG